MSTLLQPMIHGSIPIVISVNLTCRTGFPKTSQPHEHKHVMLCAWRQLYVGITHITYKCPLRHYSTHNSLCSRLQHYAWLIIWSLEKQSRSFYYLTAFRLLYNCPLISNNINQTQQSQYYKIRINRSKTDNHNSIAKQSLQQNHCLIQYGYFSKNIDCKILRCAGLKQLEINNLVLNQLI